MKVRDFSKWVAENEELVQAGPTIGEGRIKDAERKMKVMIPTALRELYRLHDGVEMAHGYVPPLLGESSLEEMLGVIRDADLGWDFTKALPFFAYQNGDYDAVDMASKEGRVVRLDPKTGDSTEIAASFEKWLDAAVKQTQAFAEDLGDAGEADDDA